MTAPARRPRAHPHRAHLARRSTAASTPSSARSATPSTCGRRSCATATRCSAERCATGRPGRAAGARRRCAAFPQDPDRWHGSFTADALGRWQFGVVAWVDRVASWKHELERKVAAGQSDLASELSEGAALLGVAVADRRGGPRRRGRRPLRADRQPTETLEIVADAERATFGSWYELFPRSWGGFAGVEKLLPEFAEARLRRALPAARAPDRAHASQGPQQRAHRAALRPGQPVGDRQRGRRAHRAASRPRERGGVREPDRARAPSSASRSRSTSRSSARPTTPGCSSTRTGSTAAPTARSSTPRTRPSATRTSTTSTSTPRTGARSGRRCATSSCTGSTAASPCSASTTRTRSRSPSGSG